MDSNTWIVFESGNTALLDTVLYEPPQDRQRPVDAYVVTEGAGSFTGAAQRAVEAGYNFAHKAWPDTKRVTVGFDIHGFSTANVMTGESGGLAMAIAFVKKVAPHDTGSVVATGTIKSGHAGGPLEPIEGIVPKMTAALAQLSEGGFFFFPEGNKSEIPAALFQEFKDRNINAEPVQSVEQALHHLFTDTDTEQRKQNTTSGVIVPQILKNGLMVCGIVLLLGACFGLGVLFMDKYYTQVDSPPESVISSPASSRVNTPFSSPSYE